MSPTRIEQPAEPITLDLTAAFSLEHGLGRSELLKIAPQLTTAREKCLADSDFACGQPQELLDEYQSSRHRSTLGQILAAAKQLRELVDRAVMLGPPPLVDAASMLFVACCHPHHNDLSRGQRGGRPRIFFAPAVPDNDALQGLLDILPHGRLLPMVDERWGVVAIDNKNCNLVAGLFGMLWELLQSTVESDVESQFAIAAGGGDSALMQFAEQAGCQRITSCESAAAMFHPGVLLAASVMGMDIVKLLRGGAMMTERFAAAPPGDNPVLDLAGLRYLLSIRRGVRYCAVDACEAALQPLSRWGDEFDRSAQHLLIQLIPQSLRRDRLRVTMRTENAPVAGSKRSARYVVELAAEKFEAAKQHRAAAGQPTAVVQLPLVDESSIGQLAQMFSLARAVRDRLTSDS